MTQSSNPIHIAVLGHLCLDVVHVPDEKGQERISQSYGGILWTVVTLANLLSPADVIEPVFGVGEADYDALVERLRRYPNVDPGGIFRFPGPTNQVHLFYSQGSESRIECSKHISPPIPFSRIRPYLDVDGVLINMISGFDITLDTLDEIRMGVRDKATPIHFDFHSLTLGIDTEFKRFRRPLADWRRWCFMVNTIQMSEEEARGLTAEQYDEATLVNQMMPLMVNSLLVTRGSRGVSLVLQMNKKLQHYDLAGIPGEPVVDRTGCGDVFGAAFFSEFVRPRHSRGMPGDSLMSAEFANRVAAAKTAFSGIDGLDTIQESLEVTEE